MKIKKRKPRCAVFADGNRTLTTEEQHEFEMRLRDIFRNWKLSRSLLADKMGVSRYTLYNYETRVSRPSLRVLEKTRVIHETIIKWKQQTIDLEDLLRC